MRKIIMVCIFGAIVIFAVLAVWFHFDPVKPTPTIVEKKLQLG